MMMTATVKIQFWVWIQGRTMGMNTGISWRDRLQLWLVLHFCFRCKARRGLMAVYMTVWAVWWALSAHGYGKVSGRQVRPVLRMVGSNRRIAPTNGTQMNLLVISKKWNLVWGEYLEKKHSVCGKMYRT